jgi:DivIVA domain-containing protein
VHRTTVVAHVTIGIMAATFLLVLVVVLVVGGLIYGVVSLLSGDDPGLVPAEPDGRARPLPNDRSLREDDLKEIRFDIALRGYRMSQVDRMLRRVAYDLGYKDEMIAVLEAEVAALREGRLEDAELVVELGEAGSAPVGAVSGESPDGRPSEDAPHPTVRAEPDPVGASHPKTSDGPGAEAPAGDGADRPAHA